MNEYALEEHHERLLTLAAEAYDRAEQARDALGEHGLTWEDKTGVRTPGPEVAIERDSRVAFARLTRELDLDGGSTPMFVRRGEPASATPPPHHEAVPGG